MREMGFETWWIKQGRLRMRIREFFNKIWAIQYFSWFFLWPFFTVLLCLCPSCLDYQNTFTFGQSPAGECKVHWSWVLFWYQFIKKLVILAIIKSLNKIENKTYWKKNVCLHSICLWSIKLFKGFNRLQHWISQIFVHFLVYFKYNFEQK